MADRELGDGAIYYAREGGLELGESFINEFERSITLLRAQSELGSVWGGKFRRLPLRRFPYNVVYFRSGDVLRVIAIAHQRRRPGYWHGRV